MKKQILLVAALLPMLAKAQSNTFTITGKIGHLSTPARVYLDYTDLLNEGGKEDSADVINGTFKFTGNLEGVATCRMALAHNGDGKMKAVYTGDAIYFQFGKNEHVVISSKDSLSNAKFTGSKIHAEEDAYNKVIGGTVMAITKMANFDFSQGTEAQRADSNFLKQVDQQFRKRLSDRTEKQLQFAKEHPNSVFGLIALSEAVNFKRDMSEIAPVYNALNVKYRDSKKGKELDQRIKSVQLTAKGAEAPVFSMKDVNGQSVSLKDLRGKTVLLEFWASWCSPCRAENPNLKEQYKLYKEKGFEILGVSLDSDKKKWEDAIAKDGIPWIHVSDLKGWSNEAGILYGVSGVPAGFLIGPDGKIIGKDLRGESLNAKLAELFKN